MRPQTLTKCEHSLTNKSDYTAGYEHKLHAITMQAYTRDLYMNLQVVNKVWRDTRN